MMHPPTRWNRFPRRTKERLLPPRHHASSPNPFKHPLNRAYLLLRTQCGQLGNEHASSPDANIIANVISLNAPIFNKPRLTKVRITHPPVKKRIYFRCAEHRISSLTSDAECVCVRAVECECEQRPRANHRIECNTSRTLCDAVTCASARYCAKDVVVAISAASTTTAAAAHATRWAIPAERRSKYTCDFYRFDLCLRFFVLMPERSHCVRLTGENAHEPTRKNKPRRLRIRTKTRAHAHCVCAARVWFLSARARGVNESIVEPSNHAYAHVHVLHIRVGNCMYKTKHRLRLIDFLKFRSIVHL